MNRSNEHLSTSGTGSAEHRLHDSQAQLHRSEQWLRMMIDSAKDYAIFAVDPQGKVCTWNKGAENLFGFSESEILGREFSLIFTPEDRAQGVPQQEVEHALSEGYAPDERWHLRKDGTRLFVSGAVRPLRDDHQVVHGFLKVAHDITHRKKSEEVLNQFRTLFESSPGLFLVLTPDDDFRVVAVSNAYLDATLTKREEVLGHGLFEVFPDDPNNPRCDGERNLRASLQRVIKERRRDVMPLQYYPIPRRHDPAGGFEERWWSPINTPVLNEHREVTHIIHRVEDMTGFVRQMEQEGKSPQSQQPPDPRLQQMAEEILLRARDLLQIREELARTNAQLEASFQAIQDGITVLDSDGNFILVNEAEFRMSGYESAAEMLRNIKDFAPIFELRSADGQLVPFEQWPWSRVLRGEVIKDWQLHGRCLETSREWHFSFSGQPVRDEHDRVTLGVVVTRDITDARHAQLAVQQARDELASANRELEGRIQERTALLTKKVQELESVSYSLSHDLRAPLRAIRSFAQILQREFRDQGQPSARALQLLDRISTSAGRLDDLIEDVLTLSRLNRERIDCKPLDLDQLVHDIIHDRAWLQPPRAQVQVTEPLLPVIGHEASLSQCLSNLLDNAVKFVAPGVQPEVHIWSERHNGLVRLNIQDNGIGIPQEHFGRIFDMFQRLHPAGVYEGTGIGLTIVRQAVERMGGSVGLQSLPGQGSRFYLDLPSQQKS